MMAEVRAAPAAAPDPELDRRFMAAALRLGRRMLGQTHPNPAVGALIVRHEGGNHIVVGRGWTERGGRPHAETLALAEAGEAARGATAYITLEPCSHDGSTPPCAEALIEAGIGRVVSAIEDPDERVAGRGHKMLRDAGIEVTTGVLAEEARAAHGGHISRVTKGRPWITLKLAVSADGMIGQGNGGRMIITGREAFDMVQGMRAESDAIAIGIGTALVDDPRLTVRLPGLADRSPIRIVFDGTAQLPVTSNLATTARETPLWLVVEPDAPAERCAALEELGVKIIKIESGPGGVGLAAALGTFAGMGLTRILVEGGARLASSLVSADLIDEVVLFRASVVVGPDGVRALAGQALSAIERSPRYRLMLEMPIGEDMKRRYLRAT